MTAPTVLHQKPIHAIRSMIGRGEREGKDASMPVVAHTSRPIKAITNHVHARDRMYLTGSMSSTYCGLW